MVTLWSFTQGELSFDPYVHLRLKHMLTLCSLVLVIMLLKDFSDDEKARLRKLMFDEGRKMCPEDPATLTGTALVAVGRK